MALCGVTTDAATRCVAGVGIVRGRVYSWRLVSGRGLAHAGQ